MEKIQYLSIDLETRSGTDLTKSGVYRYVEDADFDILLFGYSINGGDVSVVDVASGEQITATNWRHSGMSARQPFSEM